mmetsp:Transcript_32780/g.47967  ORF Transcript_32780/g.47967 Transcript_32780/m.47967 type:complete len:245 (-) Transcript_32780:223-957(-)
MPPVVVWIGKVFALKCCEHRVKRILCYLQGCAGAGGREQVVQHVQQEGVLGREGVEVPGLQHRAEALVGEPLVLAAPVGQRAQPGGGGGGGQRLLRVRAVLLPALAGHHPGRGELGGHVGLHDGVLLLQAHVAEHVLLGVRRGHAHQRHQLLQHLLEEVGLQGGLELVHVHVLHVVQRLHVGHQAVRRHPQPGHDPLHRRHDHLVHGLGKGDAKPHQQQDHNGDLRNVVRCLHLCAVGLRKSNI